MSTEVDLQRTGRVYRKGGIERDLIVIKEIPGSIYETEVFTEEHATWGCVARASEPAGGEQATNSGADVR